MPRKRWLARLSYHDNWIIKPEDRDAVDDHDLVRHALVDFDELADLPDEIREQLVADLVDAIRFWRAGVKPGKRGLSDEKEAQHIFSRMSDVPWNGPVYPQRGGVRRMRAMAPILTRQRSTSRPATVWTVAAVGGARDAAAGTRV